MILTIRGEEFSCEYVEELSTVHWQNDMPPFITFDTETTGLHLKADRPTLGAICCDHNVFVFPMNKDNARVLVLLSRRVRRVYGHNVVFDMHMFANCVGQDDAPLHIKNFGDTMCLARLSVEAISPRDGGQKLGLKGLAKKYVDPEAGKFEEELKDWMKKRDAANNKILTAFLKPFKWSYTSLTKALKDEDDIPQEVMEIYLKWRKEYPKTRYSDVPMDVMLPYVAADVILTQFLVYLMLPEVVSTDMVSTMEREFKVLPVVYKMERAGIEVDREYLLEAKQKVESYIDLLYSKLREATGMEFSVGQHAIIKQMYTDMLGEEPPSTDKKFLKKMEAKGDEAAPLITRIRRLEKWLATYIDRILKVSEYDGKCYTSMNQFNPVSGRFSGDLQQMPKDPIYTEEGYKWEKQHKGEKVPAEFILYHPRRAFTGNMFYIDYSQVELRVQAHYTMAFGGDKNLCRAYMPFGCTHYVSGRVYDHTTLAGRKQWKELRTDAPCDVAHDKLLEQGWSAWVTEEGNPWVPTDVHSATTTKALIAMGYNPDEMDKSTFKWWRNKGKTFNFMRNYGGGDGMAAQTLEIDLSAAKAMNKGYTESFPLVVTYQNAVVKQMRKRGYCVNMYGRRYYVSEWYKHYKVANYLIQGSSADMLKEKMIDIDKFISDNNLELKLQITLCVHDELQFKVTTNEDIGWAIQSIKLIMEDAPNILVPIVAEVEYANTNWADKRKWYYEGNTVDSRQGRTG